MTPPPRVAPWQQRPLARLVELKLAGGESSARWLKDHADVYALIVANDLPLEFVVELHESVRPAYVRIWDIFVDARKRGLEPNAR